MFRRIIAVALVIGVVGCPVFCRLAHSAPAGGSRGERALAQRVAGCPCCCLPLAGRGHDISGPHVPGDDSTRDRDPSPDHGPNGGARRGCMCGGAISGPLVVAPELPRALDAPPLAAVALPCAALEAIRCVTGDWGESPPGPFAFEASPGRAARVRECSLLL